MLKRIALFFAILALSLVFTVTLFAAGSTPRLNDAADILTHSEEKSISAMLDEVSEKYNVDFVIAAVDSAGNYSPDDYAEYYYDSYGFGIGEGRDGVLLILIMDERDYRILSNGLGATAISLSDIDYIGEEIVPYLSNGDYADAFRIFIEECEYLVNGEINGFPFDFTLNLLISLVIGFVIAFIATGIMKGKLKSVRKQLSATEYTKKDSMQITASNDFFLYSVVNRRRKENNSSSRSSGSSRNVGGGKF